MKSLMPCLMFSGVPSRNQHVQDAAPSAIGSLQFAVQAHVLGTLQTDARERQEMQPLRRKIADLLFSPFARVGKVWLEIVDHRGDGGILLRADLPEIQSVYLRDPAG